MSRTASGTRSHACRLSVATALRHDTRRVQLIAPIRSTSDLKNSAPDEHLAEIDELLDTATTVNAGERQLFDL